MLNSKKVLSILNLLTYFHRMAPLRMSDTTYKKIHINLFVYMS
jgi:hypothetical protein